MAAVVAGILIKRHISASKLEKEVDNIKNVLQKSLNFKPAEKIEFKEAKTVEEAAAFAKEHFGVAHYEVDNLEVANWINKNLVLANNATKGQLVLPNSISHTLMTEPNTLYAAGKSKFEGTDAYALSIAKDFENYLTKNSKSKGTYTVEEMQLITDVFCPIITTQGNWFSIAKDKMKAAVEKLDETGFSKNVLKFIHMLTTPFPPVSDTAKNKYKDILEELEELSKEMEENYLQRIKINNEYNNNYVSKIKSQLSLNNDVLNIEDKINSLLNGLIERLKVDK